MKELHFNETPLIAGGGFKFRINIGTFLAGAVLGFITGGPVGVGYAVGAAIMAQGINSLDEMYNNGEPY